MQKKSWLEQKLYSVSNTFEEWAAMMSTTEFWGIVAAGATLIGFLLSGAIMLTNFDMMRMSNCFNASNLSAYLLFNVLLFFVFDGLLALGEIFNYFDNRKNGIPYKRSAMFWLAIVTLALGSIGLIMVKNSCG